MTNTLQEIFFISDLPVKGFNTEALEFVAVLDFARNA